MGYYVDLIDSNFRIPETSEVLSALKEMPVKYKSVQQGGSYSGGGTRESWFSWINDSAILGAETAESIFNTLGFDTQKEEGCFSLEGYSSKTGQEELFLSTVAPFVKDGSFTEWKGEDNAHYKYVVRYGRLLLLEGVVEISYGEEKTFLIHHLCEDKTCKGGEKWHYHNYDPVTMKEIEPA